METVTYGSASSDRSPWKALLSGFLGRCPQCGRGRIFGRFLKVRGACDHCAEEFRHHRADDLPAYLVIFIVGHIVLPAFVLGYMLFDLSTWQHLAIWVPLTIIMSLVLLQPVKGAVVSLQWALRMHGFGDDDDDGPGGWADEDDGTHRS